MQTEIESLPAYCSLKKWVEISGISRSKSYMLMKSGDLPAKKVGGKTLLKTVECLAWIDAQPDYRPNA